MNVGSPGGTMGNSHERGPAEAGEPVDTRPAQTRPEPLGAMELLDVPTGLMDTKAVRDPGFSGEGY